jgi:tetratricopeptide (TPR) repeat protein
MKFLLVLASVSLLSYAIYLPIQQNVALYRANATLAAGNLESAMAYVDAARREGPQFYADRASAVCGDITLARAQRMADSAPPDFGGAAGLLRDLAKQCGASGRDAEAARLLDRVSALHLARATLRCQQQEYASALLDLEQFLTLPYPERSLGQARAESAWCRLELAKALAQQQRFDTALAHLHRLLSGEHGAVREATLKLVPAVVEDELGAWLGHQQYPQAFKHLGERQQVFGGYPDLAHFFAEVGSQAELQVFGVVLARQCHEPVQPRRATGKNAKPTPQGRPPGPVTVATAPGVVPVNGASAANLVIHNDTKHHLKVLLRGREQHNVLLAPQARQELSVAPAEYLVGVYAPGNCLVQPDRTAWTIKARLPHSVRFYEGQAQ